MPHLRAFWRRLPTGFLGLLALLLLLSGCGAEQYPQTTLVPRAEFAARVDELFRITVWLALVVFVVVEGALLYTIFRFKGSPDDPEPEQTHGNVKVELIWTIIPAVVLAMVAVPTIRTIIETAEVPTTSPDGQPPLKVEVIGHQWWWEIRYPELGITTSGDWHVPQGRTVDLRMKSVDVVHSFWVPQFAGKRDVFPNRETRIWFTPEVTGEFPGACAEFCGTQHARMAFYLLVDSPQDFDAWVARRLADSTSVGFAAPDSVTLAAMDPVTRTGEDLFRSKGCVGCHTLAAKGGLVGLTGPNLSGIGTRTRLAGGWLPNTDENLAKWIQDPQQFKHGVTMRPKGNAEPEITDAEAQALVAYLRTKR